MDDRVIARGASSVTGVSASGSEEAREIDRLLTAMGKNEASDLHMKADMKPVFRISTQLREVGTKALTNEMLQKMMYSTLREEQIRVFENTGDLDYAYSIPQVGRFRVNMFLDRGAMAVAIRRVNTKIPSFEDLHLPEGIGQIPMMRQGLAILAGPTGQGKSTTLASVLQYINDNRRVHIITIEDPIEYLLPDSKSFVNQREIGIDVRDFHTALRHVVRQNPDVILVGEMRDAESIDAGLMAAETGHLVFGTIHASSSAQTIGRILDFFPTERQDQIRQLLVFNLKAIVCQKLMRGCRDDAPMVPAVEIMLASPTIQKLIANKEDKKIQDVIRGGTEEGMQDFNQSLVSLIDQGLVSKKVAMQYSPNPEQLKMNLQGIYLGEDHKIIG